MTLNPCSHLPSAGVADACNILGFSGVSLTVRLGETALVLFLAPMPTGCGIPNDLDVSLLLDLRAELGL